MITLSILIVSHNQRDLLERCIKSVLAQKISVSYEIIISDDNSSDGSWELILSYSRLYPGLVFGFKCNSDDCNPVHVSERCGWNKRNAMINCHGKYMVNIDADDYLLSDDIYQKQIDMLEAHPECSMCMQRVMSIPHDKTKDEGFEWPISEKIRDNEILSAYDIIVGRLLGLNQSYMIRTYPESHPERYGKMYDDTIITLHHLQYGPVVAINRSDYAWIRYPGSITNSLSRDDNLVIYATVPLIHTILIPQFAGLFMAENSKSLYLLIKKLLSSPCKIAKTTSDYISQFDGFIFRQCRNNCIKFKDKVRIFSAFSVLWISRKFSIVKPSISKLIYSLLLSSASANRITDDQWAISK